nr:DIS3-like exonuclease 2 isoform X2 [Tanacetum cinerariifolium]
MTEKSQGHDGYVCCVKGLRGVEIKGDCQSVNELVFLGCDIDLDSSKSEEDNEQCETLFIGRKTYRVGISQQNRYKDATTASDLDDAKSVEKLPNYVYRVAVHIVDVSYFVHPHTALYLEAQMRSTSMYLMHHKLPMLPPVLSDNLGSFCPGVERLAFSVMWDINLHRMVLDHWIGLTLVKSCCKLLYKNAQDNLYGVINVKEDALSLDHLEIKFLFDENEKPYDIVFFRSENFKYLVEEFMLLANTTVAEVITRAYPSCAFLRRHPKPKLSKLKDLDVFCGKLSLKLDTSSSSLFHESLESIRHELNGDVIDNGNDWNNYALVVPLYTHLTSPLRRYPDIVVHRTLAATLKAEGLMNLNGTKSVTRCFTGLSINKEVETFAFNKALVDATVEYALPCTEVLADIATYCNGRRLATRLAKDALNKLYMWLLLRNKELESFSYSVEVAEWVGFGDNDRLVGKWKHLYGKWTSSHVTLTKEKQATKL